MTIPKDGRKRKFNKRKFNKRKPIYVAIPRPMLRYPPIQHAGSDQDRLTVFEFAITSAILVAARRVLTQLHHEEAFKGGGAAIRLERWEREQFKQNWRRTNKLRREGTKVDAPYMAHAYDLENQVYKPGPIRKGLKRAAIFGYKEGLKQARKSPPPATLVVEVKPTRLLSLARIGKTGPRLKQTLAALDRLLSPVVGHPDYPAEPLLHEWRQDRSGRLHLKVSGEWLQLSFGKVPLPLPMSGATVLALFLFICTIKPNNISKRATDFAHLCRRLGIPNYGSYKNSRAIERAFKGLNAHLATLDYDALYEEAKISFAAIYKMAIAGDNSVRIKSYEDANDAVDHEADDRSPADYVTDDDDDDEDDDIEAEADEAEDAVADEPEVIERRRHSPPTSEYPDIDAADISERGKKLWREARRDQEQREREEANDFRSAFRSSMRAYRAEKRRVES